VWATGEGPWHLAVTDGGDFADRPDEWYFGSLVNETLAGYYPPVTAILTNVPTGEMFGGTADITCVSSVTVTTQPNNPSDLLPKREGG
jgi:hypothetical protein